MSQQGSIRLLTNFRETVPFVSLQISTKLCQLFDCYMSEKFTLQITIDEKAIDIVDGNYILSHTSFKREYYKSKVFCRIMLTLAGAC